MFNLSFESAINEGIQMSLSEPSERIPLQMGFVMKKLRKKGSFYSRVVSRHAASNELSILTKSLL